ncbi:LLM class flavin-dependent oxidoreductase [Bacillus sp. 37MA]|uniref:LLM class flavin-dependent oxidoreductase n=1 Tax=Bacillus sp. 37MA TaxID=1132442 RepID=UPI00037B819E|nr:LLM class flavin-dependent oxidoreductase [Bacillus sp. 37MA]
MANKKKQMKLGVFLMIPGHHLVAWRHPEAQSEDILNFEFIKQLAQTAERGKFDALFLRDLYHFSNNGFQSAGGGGVSFEPLTLLSAISTVTEKIGLIGTVSTSFNEPFNVARKFASLDLLSKGRAGWNVVTSIFDSESQNFNLDHHLPPEKRYERAEEFVDVVTKLWDGWEDGALVIDKESGTFIDGSKIHQTNHQGEWFKVAGPLNIPRPVQGHPVVVQAGSSDAGKELAARTAEVIFTAWQTIEEAQAFYADLKGRMKKYGRDPEELKIMPGVFPIIGHTEEEANAKKQLFDELISEEAGVALLSSTLNVDLSQYPVDGPLPDLPPAEQVNGYRSRFQLLKDLADREGLTIRQLYLHIAGGRGHREIKGTPEQIADQLQLWIENDAADGFNIMPPYFPGGLDDFVELVIPILQERGIFRTDYEGSTLRDHLGLKRPENIFTKNQSALL